MRQDPNDGFRVPRWVIRSSTFCSRFLHSCARNGPGILRLLYRSALLLFLIFGVAVSTIDLGHHLWLSASEKKKSVTTPAQQPDQSVDGNTLDGGDKKKPLITPVQQPDQSVDGNTLDGSMDAKQSSLTIASESIGDPIPRTLHVIEFLLMGLLPLLVIDAFSAYLIPLSEIGGANSPLPKTISDLARVRQKGEQVREHKLGIAKRGLVAL